MISIKKAFSGLFGLLFVLLLGSQATAQDTGDLTPLEMKYLGAAGWEITDGKVVVLIDPYISRLK